MPQSAATTASESRPCGVYGHGFLGQQQVQEQAIADDVDQIQFLPVQWTARTEEQGFRTVNLNTHQSPILAKFRLPRLPQP